MNFEKYFEEVVNKEQFVARVKGAKEELLLNMMEYQGVVHVTTIIDCDSSENVEKDFLDLLRVPKEECEDVSIEDFVYDTFENLAEDLTELCEEEDIDIEGFALGVGYSDDGDISVSLTYDDFDSIQYLSEEEYQLHKALSEEFDCQLSEVVDNGNGEFQIAGYEYYVLTDDEANEKAKDYIQETLWAFNPSFLSGETGLPQEIFDALAESGRCESNNDAILQVVEATCGLDSLVDSAISSDGRGHYMNSYDGEEIEVETNSETYYCYRQG